MEIFNRTASQLAGAWSADQGVLALSGGVPSALVQTINAVYAQAITRLYEIGNNGNAVGAVVGGAVAVAQATNVYYVGGRAQGTMGVARVIGPAAIMAAFYKKFSDVCQAASNMLTFTLNSVNCGTTAAVYTAKYCVLTQVGLAVAAQDMVVNESSQLTYSGFDYQGP